MSTTKYRLGDLVYIPLQSGKGVVAKILYISNRNSKVILLGIFEGILDGKPNPNIYESDKNTEYAVQPFYTSAELILDGKWEIIGNVEVSDSDEKLSLRIYAGRVYLGHDVLRRASKVDYESIPKEAVKGFGMVNELIQEYIK